jgi:acrylyl-CoA reductase (NADPH)
MNNPIKFKALVVRKNKNYNFTYELEDVGMDFLPDNDVVIKVHYSSINYKDCLSCQGNMGITRRFPHIPGIDAAGIVIESKDKEWKTGDKVIILSHDLGMNTCGGFGQIIKVPGRWITRLPNGMSLFECMALGTAGYTALLAVNAIEDHVKPSSSECVIVTGATGGVGTLAVYLLNSLGYNVTAVTGKKSTRGYLTNLGAKNIIFRDDFVNYTDRNLLPEKYIAGVDVAGGATLTTLIRSIKSKGVVVSTGMVDSTKISLTVLPFILRGISLVGVNADLSYAHKEDVWKKILNQIPKSDYSLWATTIMLDELPAVIKSTIKNSNIGRIVVDMKSGDKI